MMVETLDLSIWLGGGCWQTCLVFILFFMVGVVAYDDKDNDAEGGDGDEEKLVDERFDAIVGLLTGALRFYEKIQRDKASGAQSLNGAESSAVKPSDGAKESKDLSDQGAVDGGTVWQPNSEFLENENVSVDEKVAYFRERLEDSDETARIPLVKSLIVQSRNKVREDEVAGFQLLDEAQTLVEEIKSSGSEDEEEYDGILIEIIAHRTLFHLGFNREPPVELVRELRDKILRFEPTSDSLEAYLCLLRAWFVHAQALLTLGASSAAISSFKKSFKVLDDMKSRWGDEITKIPDAAFLLFAYGKACETLGDVETAIKAYRRASDLFSSFRKFPSLLLKSAMVNDLLANLLTSSNKRSAARETVTSFRRRIQRYWKKNAKTRRKLLRTFVRSLFSEAVVYVRTGDLSTAIRSLQKAERALAVVARSARKSKNAHFPVSMRSLFVETYTMRASLFFAQRHYMSALSDCFSGLSIFKKLIAKRCSINLERAFVGFFTLFFNITSQCGKWKSYKSCEKLFSKFLRLVPPENSTEIASMVSDIALKLHRANQLQGNSDRAKKWIDVSVESLSKVVEKIDDVSPRSYLVLAKNLTFRCAFQFIIQGDRKGAFEDLQRLETIFQDADLLPLVGVDHETTECYLEFLRRYSCMTWENGEREKAVVQLKKFFRVLNVSRRNGNLAVLKELNDLVSISLRFAEESGSPQLFFKLFRLWSNYIRLVRTKILKSNLSVKHRRRIENDYATVNLYLYNARIHFLNNLQWDDCFNQFLPKQGAQVACSVFSAFNQVNSEQVEEATKDLGCPSFTELVNARKRFVFEVLIKHPRDFILWHDLQMCSRLVERQIAEEDEEAELKILSYVACRLSDLYWSYGETKLAFSELYYTKVVVDKAIVQKDSALASALLDGDVVLCRSAEVGGDSASSNNADGVQKMIESKVTSFNDSVFWNSVFVISQAVLIAFERFCFGKESLLSARDSRLVDWSIELPTLVWAKPDSDDDEKTEEESEANAIDEEISADGVGSEDYLSVDEHKKEVFNQLLEISRRLGRKAVMHDFLSYTQYKKIFRLFFEWRCAWEEIERLKKEVNDELDALEANVNSNLNGEMLALDFCEEVANFAIDVLDDAEYAIKLHERLMTLSTNRFPFATFFAAARLNHFYGRFFFVNLAHSAINKGNVAEALDFLFRALNERYKFDIGQTFLEECLTMTAEVLCAFYSEDSPDVIKLARRFSSQFEKTFDLIFEQIKESSEPGGERSLAVLHAAWRCFTAAGVYFDEQRRCFYLAHRYFNKAWDIIRSLLFESDNLSGRLFFSSYFANSVIFNYYNGLIETSLLEGEIVATICRIFSEDASYESSDPSSKQEIQEMFLQMNLLHMAGTVFYGTEPLSSEERAKFFEVLQSSSEYTEFTRRKLPNANLSLPFVKQSGEEDDALDENSLRVGAYFFIAKELDEFAKFDEIGFDSVKRQVKSLRVKLRKTVLKQTLHELEFEFNWVQFACLKQNWTEACRNARRLLKRFYPCATASEEERRMFQLIRLELLKIETYCVLRQGRRREVVRCRATLDEAFQLFQTLFSQRYFEIRTVYPELLTLRAWRFQILGESTQVLKDSLRAKRLFERFKARGFSILFEDISAVAALLVTTSGQSTGANKIDADC